MKNLFQNVVNSISEGIVIINADYEIVYFNEYMAFLTGTTPEDVIGKSVFIPLPKLNKNYFINFINTIYHNGSRMFFSAAIHQNLVSHTYKLNLKISKINSSNNSYILLEFIDVTNQYLTIAQLKETINMLHYLNEELKIKEKTIESLAYYDNLTGVANRNLFYKISEELYQEAHSNQQKVSLLFIDIDNFKTINDTYGHKIGDQVIVAVSQSLTNITTDRCRLVVRYGGDEFLLFFCVDDDNEVITIANAVLENNEVMIEGYPIHASLSIGISIENTDHDSIDDLITKAEKAMYIVKRNGGNGWRLWNDSTRGRNEI